jgi:Ca2+-binding RTX toxin-like protein
MTTATRKIAFIDSRVADYPTLIDGLAEGTEWFLLDAGTDGIRQMESILSGYTDLEAIEVISHGSPGRLYLGSTVLDSGNLSAYQSSLHAISSSLCETGDILLYGCSVAQGEAGIQFIESLAAMTGADVAASADPTGAAELGGNWVLEAEAGAVEASPDAPTAANVMLGTDYRDLDSGNLWSLMATCAQAAYWDGDVARMHLLGAGSPWEPIGSIDLGLFTDHYDPTTGLFSYWNSTAFIARSGNTAVISFGGTDDVIDAIQDAVGMYPQIWNLLPLIDAFDQYIASNPAITTVFVTGHSLGGALAQAYMLCHPNDPNANGVSYQAVTFAAPGFNYGTPAGYAAYQLSMLTSDSKMADLPLGYFAHDGRVLHFEIAGDVVPDVLHKIGDTIHLDVQGVGGWIDNHAMALYKAAVGLLDQSLPESDIPLPRDAVDVLMAISGSGPDHYIVGTGNNNLTDNDPINTTEYIIGGSGDDTLGGSGKNRLYGGAGNDTYEVGQTDDVVVETDRDSGDAGGWDTVIASCDYTLSEYVDVLRLAADTGRIWGVPDWFDEPFNGTGNNQANWIEGNNAANTLRGLGGNDTIVGLQGADSLYGGAGDDTYIYRLGDGNDTITDTSGIDLLVLYGVSLTDLRQVESIGVSGELRISIDTWGFNDSIRIEPLQAPGNQAVEHFEVDGEVFLGTSLSTLVGQIRTGALGGTDDFGRRTLTRGDDLFVGGGLLFHDNEVWGLGGHDRLYGSDGDDTLHGGDGADWLNGGEDQDIIFADSGHDTVVFTEGNDIIDGGSGVDTLRVYLAFANQAVILNNFPDATSLLLIDGVQAGAISNVERLLITTGSGDDVIRNTGASGPGDDIDSGGGNDTIELGAGDDYVDAGAGNDTVELGAGNDYVDGGAGDDTIKTGAGSDEVYGGSGDDVIDAGRGDGAFIDGGGGFDTLSFDLGDQFGPLWLEVGLAEGGFQFFFGSYARFEWYAWFESLRTALAGATWFAVHDDYGHANVGYRNVEAVNWTAGAGDDLIVFQGGTRYDGGGGNDTFYADFSGTAQAVNWDADAQSFSQVDGVTVANIERLLLATGSGNDLIRAMSGGLWHHVETGAGNDTVELGAGYDHVDGGAGNDTIKTGAGSDKVYGGSGDDWLYGNQDNDYLSGAVGNDWMHGGQGNDALDGGTGNDTLTGGLGNDRLIGGEGVDTADYTASSDAVTVSLAAAGSQAVSASQGSDTLTELDNLTGSAFGDTLTGNGGANVLNGLAGNDTVSGGTGNDTLNGGDGNDWLYGNQDATNCLATRATTWMHGGQGQRCARRGHGQ